MDDHEASAATSTGGRGRTRSSTSFLNPLNISSNNPEAEEGSVGDAGAGGEQGTTSGPTTLAGELQVGVFGAVGLATFQESEADVQNRHRKDWGGLLHPDTKARRIYDMSQLTIMLFLLWRLPTRFAFKKTPHTVAELVIDVLIDLSVCLDIFMQMRLYHYDEKTKVLVTSKARIKRAYLRSWFFVDFFSVVPVDAVLLVLGLVLVNHATNSAQVELGEQLLEWSVGLR
jgi:hypothetical protein